MSLSQHEQSALELAVRDPAKLALFLGGIARKSDPKWFGPLKRAGLLSPDRAPAPGSPDAQGSVSVPYWGVLPYLIGLSRIHTDQTARLIPELLEIVRGVSTASVAEGAEKGNSHTWSAFVEILSYLPPETVPLEILSYVPMWVRARYGGDFVGVEAVTKLLPMFLRGDATQIPKAQALFESLTEFVWVAVPEDKRELRRGKARIAKTLIEPYFFTAELVHGGLAKEVGAKCEPQVVLRATKMLMDILDDGRNGSRHVDDVSSIWLPDLASGPSTGDDDPEELYAYLLRELLAGLGSNRPGECRGPLEELLGDRYHYPIFRRLAFHTIDEQWRDLRVSFVSKLDHEHLREWLTLPSCRLELLRLLAGHAVDLDDTLKQVVATAIEEGPGLTKTGKPYPVGMEAEWKRETLYGLKEDTLFGALYEKYRTITKNDREPAPPFRIETRIGPGPSPSSPQELQSMDGPSLAAHLASFVPGDPWNGPALDGLCDSLKRAVAEDPAAFTPKLPALLEAKLPYAAHVVWGYMEAWKAKKPFDWQHVLSFLNDYTKTEEFWTGARASAYDDRDSGPFSVVSMAADLIEDGAKRDDLAFHPDLLPVAIKLLAGWYSRTKARSATTVTDPLTAAFNTNRGVLLRAMVTVALRTGRLLRDNVITGAARWPAEFSSAFDLGFEQDDPDAFVLFGYFLRNFHFLDWEWAKRKISDMDSALHHETWVAFMHGYLFQRDLVPDVHSQMEKQLRQALQEPKLNDDARRWLVDHICISYVRGLDEFGSHGLMDALLEEWNPNRLEAAVWFFWSGRDYYWGQEAKGESAPSPAALEDARKRALGLWRALASRFMQRDAGDATEADRRIAFESAKLCVFLQSLEDDSTEVLVRSAQCAQQGLDTMNLVEALCHMKGRESASAVRIGRILRAVPPALLPMYDTSGMKDLVQFLLDHRESRAAGMDIQDEYVKRGDTEFLELRPAQHADDEPAA